MKEEGERERPFLKEEGEKPFLKEGDRKREKNIPGKEALGISGF